MQYKSGNEREQPSTTTYDPANRRRGAKPNCKKMQSEYYEHLNRCMDRLRTQTRPKFQKLRSKY